MADQKMIIDIVDSFMNKILAKYQHMKRINSNGLELHFVLFKMLTDPMTLFRLGVFIIIGTLDNSTNIHGLWTVAKVKTIFRS
jgi:hypothetical protein